MTERHATYSPELEALLSNMPRRHALFTREYFIDLNATQAAKRAEYSEHTARQQGSRLLSNAAINAAIDLFMERRADEIAIDAALIEREYWSLYKEARDNEERAVARSCLDKLGDYHAMFIKQVAFLDAGQLEARLSKGRARLNEGHVLNPSPAGPSDPVQ